MDETDAQILNLLQEDASRTNARLAELVGISPAGMLQRVRRLEEAGVIRGYVARLDPAAVGQPICALVSVSLKEHGKGPLDEFKAQVAGFQEVLSCWHTAGEADFVLRVVAPDMASYERFVVDRLSAIPCIGRVRTSFCLDTVLDRSALPLDRVVESGRQGGG